jgi:hypothetical protein
MACATDATPGRLRMPDRRLRSAGCALAGVATYGMTFFLPQVVSQLKPGLLPHQHRHLRRHPLRLRCHPMLLLVRYADISGRLKFIVLACFATAIVGLIMTAVLRGSPVLGMIGLILLECGVIGNIPTYWALISEVLTKRQAVVGIAGIQSTAPHRNGSRGNRNALFVRTKFGRYQRRHSQVGSSNSNFPGQAGPAPPPCGASAVTSGPVPRRAAAIYAP